MKPFAYANAHELKRVGWNRDTAGIIAALDAAISYPRPDLVSKSNLSSWLIR